MDKSKTGRPAYKVEIMPGEIVVKDEGGVRLVPAYLDLDEQVFQVSASLIRDPLRTATASFRAGFEAGAEWASKRRGVPLLGDVD